jgi:hypothetical protein
MLSIRATLEQAVDADVILHVIDRSSPSWQKQRDVVRAELASMYAQDRGANPSADHAGGEGDSDSSGISGSGSGSDAVRASVGAGGDHHPIVIEVWNKMDRVCNTTAGTPEAEFEALASRVIAESCSQMLAPASPSRRSKGDNDSDWLATPAAIVPISALHRKGVWSLVRRLSSVVADDLIEATCCFRYGQPALPSTETGGTSGGAVDVGKWTGQIYRQGEVKSAEYTDTGVQIRCKLPEALYNKLAHLGVIKVDK